MQKIAGTLLIKNGLKYDYCFEAAIKSMQSFCEHIFIVYVDSEDNTLDVLNSLINNDITIIYCKKEDWDNHNGRTKLSEFTNIAIQHAQSSGYEYQFNLQGDEVIAQESIPYIKRAIELGEEAYYITRHNFWKDEKHILNVPQSKKPVSTQICRLAKTSYRSVDDAESIAAPASLDFINLIEINHYGFIRNNKKHIDKIKEMQKNIFQFDNYDGRADLKPEFDWKDWGFTEEDLIPYNNPTPIYVKEWIENRNK